MTQAAQVNPTQDQLTNPVAAKFLDCLVNSDRRTYPYKHWLLSNPLPDNAVDAITSLPFDPPNTAIFNGKRETNNSTRVYFTPENQEKFEVCRKIVEGFKNPRAIEVIEKETGADLSDSHLRVEYCQDCDGFWLEPHTDIFVKKFTMLVYLSDEHELQDAGTDLYEGPPEFKYVGSAPYAKNKGLIFIPGKNTWHGVSKRPIKGIRKSIIINYVTSDWRDKWELA